MKDPRRTLQIEEPDTQALVDFIDKAGVTLTLEEDKLIIEIKATHGKGASTWDEHYFEVELPEQEQEEEDDEMS